MTGLTAGSSLPTEPSGPTEPSTALEARIARYYGEQFDEEARLTTRSGQGPIELARTLQVVRQHLASGRLLDVGGGTGHHARALMDAGWDVELIDPVDRHVAAARARGVRARRGDARSLDAPTDSVDGVLLLGPLYHLADREDRLTALREAARVTRPGGTVFAAGLSRLVAFAKVFLQAPPPAEPPSAWGRLLTTGADAGRTRFPAGHFHTPEELAAEVAASGLLPVEVVGVEGPGGLLLEALPEADERTVAAAAVLAEAGSALRGVRDLSAHLLAVARTP